MIKIIKQKINISHELEEKIDDLYNKDILDDNDIKDIEKDSYEL